MDIKFPRYIYAVGGAGKELVYTMFEKEWILREIIRPKFNSTQVDIVIIDTALDEENDDTERRRNIEEKIKDIESEYSSNPDPAKSLGRINISYRLLTKEMVLQTPYSIVGVGEQIKKATGAKVWWINDPQLGQDWHEKVMNRENFRQANFAKGVYRKRAIGKAIYYKALAENLFKPNIFKNDQVDIIIGLGGGTGSGIVMDLARQLKSIQDTADITLFGVLSTIRESSDEKANNLAILSELEYASINKDPQHIFPFKDIVLVPMEVTEYGGEERANELQLRLIKEFDETFPYILVSYHMLPQLFFAGIPDYAPFIISTSQLVRYNVDLIKEFKNRFLKALQDKETSLQDEEKIYTVIRKFINEAYSSQEMSFTNVSTPSSTLSSEDRSLIEERFSKFKLALYHEFFDKLNYSSVIHLKNAVESGIKSSTSDSIDEQVPIIKSNMDVDVIPTGEFVDDIDSKLYKILKKDIEIIETLKTTISLVNKVPDNIIRDTLRIIIKVDERNLGINLERIRREINNLNSRNSQLDTDINSLKIGLSIYQNQMSKDVESRNQEWRHAVMKDINALDFLDKSSRILNVEVDNLKNGLSDFASKINSTNSIRQIDSEPTATIENFINRISEVMRPIYIEFPELSLKFNDQARIIQSFNTLKELRKEQIFSKSKVPLLDKIIGVFVKTKRLKRQKEAINAIPEIITRLHNHKVFEIRDNTPFVIYEPDIIQKIHETKDSIITSIITSSKNNYPDINPTLLSNLRSSLEYSDKRQTVNIMDIILHHLKYDIEIKRREDEIREKDQERVQFIYRINVLSSLESKLTEITKILKSHSTNLKNYHDHMINMGKDIEKLYRMKRDDIRYKMEIQPRNIFRATSPGANINDVLQDIGEKTILKQNLMDGIDRLIDNKYNVLHQRIIQNRDSTKVWDKNRVVNIFITNASDIGPDSDTERTIRDAFNLQTPRSHSDLKILFGDSWSIGLNLFVAGVPFDNIRNIIDPADGYFTNYRLIERDGTIFFHHAYLLEEGKLIKRKRIFNLEMEEDKKLILQNDKEVRALIAENYETIDLQNCL